MEKELLNIINEMCNTLNKMEEYESNEKIIAVYEIVKDKIDVIAQNREIFFVMFSDTVKQKCNQTINDEYGFYEGLIVALCGGVI